MRGRKIRDSGAAAVLRSVMDGTVSFPIVNESWSHTKQNTCFIIILLILCTCMISRRIYGIIISPSWSYKKLRLLIHDIERLPYIFMDWYTFEIFVARGYASIQFTTMYYNNTSCLCEQVVNVEHVDTDMEYLKHDSFWCALLFQSNKRKRDVLQWILNVCLTCEWAWFLYSVRQKRKGALNWKWILLCEGDTNWDNKKSNKDCFFPFYCKLQRSFAYLLTAPAG